MPLRRSAALVATVALSLAGFAAGPARAAAAPAAAAPHQPAAVAGWAVAMGDPAPPPALPSPLDSSGSAQVQALVQKYQTDAQNDEQKANQLSTEKGTLEKRAGDIQNRETNLESQASSLKSRADALNSQAETLNNEIAAHNAEPHTFELPDQEAAYEAYNEEKANLDGQKASLQNQLSSLSTQNDKLEGDQAKVDADQNQLATDVQTHNDAVSALETDVEQLAGERQQILTQIDDLLQNEADATQDAGPAPAAEGGDESEPPAAADPPAQTQALPSGGGDEPAPTGDTYTPGGEGETTSPGAPTGSTTGPEGETPPPVVTRAPVRVTLSPSTVSRLPASQAEDLQPSETFDGLIPEANGKYAAVEDEPPAGTAQSPAQKAFDDAIDNGGEATTPVNGKPVTIDKIVPEGTAEGTAPAENEGGDTPRPAASAPARNTGDWSFPKAEPTPGEGPPVSIDALHDLLDQRGLGHLADQYDLEYEPVVLDENGDPAYVARPTDAEGNPELGATGKPILRFSNLGLNNPTKALSSFENETLDGSSPEDFSPCPEHSFSGATRVLMADGSTEAIADVRVGDLVENAQPGGGTEVHRVDQVHVTTTDTGFVDVTVAGSTPGSGGTVTGTANHPYYDGSVGGFVDAGALRPGDRLQSSGADTRATVGGVRPRVGPIVTYDLTIDGLHTYYVVAGRTPVLVHNCGNSDAQADLATLRSELNMPAAGTPEDGATLARLDMEGQEPLYGQNGRIPRPTDYPGKGNGISKLSWDDHAEGDVFSQAKALGYRGGNANLYLDRKPCPFCQNSYAGYGRMLGVDTLKVYTPNGLYGTYTSGGKFIPAK